MQIIHTAHQIGAPQFQLQKILFVTSQNCRDGQQTLICCTLFQILHLQLAVLFQTKSPITVRTELHRHPAVATLSTYIHWKMEDDHTYHNRQVHDNTIHHMVLTTYFSMHVRNLSKVLYLLCLWCLLTIVSSNSHTGLVWRFYCGAGTARCRCSPNSPVLN